MIMIRDLMAVAIVGVHQINDVLMGVAVLFDLRVVFRNDLCQFRKIMGDRARVRRKQHTNRQSDG